MKKCARCHRQMSARTKRATCEPCRKYQRARYYGVNQEDGKAAITLLAAKVAKIERAMYQMRADYRKVYEMAYKRGAMAAKRKMERIAEPVAIDESELQQISHVYQSQ